MPRPRSISEIQHLTSWSLARGLFADRNHIDIPEGGASEVNNMIYLDGKLRPRPGLTAHLSPLPVTGKPLVLVGRYQRLDQTGPNIMLVFRDGTSLIVYERYSGAWVHRGTLASVTTADDMPTYTNFKGAWFLAPGDGELYYLSPTASVMEAVDTTQTVVALQPPDKPKIVTTALDRLFAANVLDGETGERVTYRVHWCDHLRHDVWGSGVGAGTAGFIDLADDNEGITALYTYNDFLLVFKENSLYAGRFIGGDRSYDIRPFADGPGCVAVHSLRRYRDSKIVWLGPDNVYMTRPGELPTAVGDAIENRIRTTVDLANIGKSSAICDRDNELYYLFMPGSGVTKVFCLNMKETSWFEGTLHSSIDVLTSEEVRSAPWSLLPLVGSSNGKLYNFSLSNTQDDGNNIAGDWTSGLFSVERLYKQSTQQALIQQVRAFASSPGSINTHVITSDGVDQYDTRDFGTQEFGTDKENLKTERAKPGEFFKLKLSFPDAAEAAHIEGIGTSLVTMGDTHK